MTVKDQVHSEDMQTSYKVKQVQRERPIWLSSKMRRNEALAAYLCILPWLLGFLFFALGPIVVSFILMFMRWEVLTPPEFIGLDNFHRFFADPLVS